MIKKLRIKFIVISISSTILVLFIILGVINLLNYREAVSRTDVVLELLLDNQGRLPRDSYKIARKKNAAITPELSFEARYFSVFISDSGEIEEVDLGKIAAVDEEMAQKYARKVEALSKEEGFISNYRYAMESTSGGTRIIFFDCSRYMESFEQFLVTSIFVSVCGVAAVFALIVGLSKKAIEPVSASYEKQKQFITDAGHEMKTPLTIIDADTSILEMEYGDSEWLRDIQMQTKRMAGLTNDLIYLSRMEEGQKLQMIDFPFSDIILETAQSFQNLAMVQNKNFVIDVESMLNFRGDENAIRQLVSVLLDNAVKYSGENGKIRLCARKKGRNIYMTVFNTADNIKKENTELLFDRFYRTDASRNSQTGGYGIGLSIAKAVTEAHNGRITASTEDEKSLQITVILPKKEK